MKFTSIFSGDSFSFLERAYKIGKKEKLQIGDEVIIHPVPNKWYKPFTTSGFDSGATRPYPAKIIVKEIKWIKDAHKYASFNLYNPKKELCLVGIEDNSYWHGAVLNEYAFSRLEFKKRNHQNG